MLVSINRVISLKNCFLGLKRKSQKSLHSSGSAIIAPWLLLFLLPLVRKGFRPPAYLANLPAITMTDIARPCNPVLSFSSFNDEPVAYGTRALPPDTIVEMEIPSPRTTITAGRFEIDDDNGRSKSAPPSHFVSENKDPTSSLLLLPSTYDPRQRPESTPARALPHDCQTKFADEDPDVDEVPAVAIGAVIRQGNPCPAVYIQAESLTAASGLVVTRPSSSALHPPDPRENRPLAADGRKLTRPVPLAPPPKNPNGKQTGQFYHPGAGTFLLRPNPVKAAQVIVQTTTTIASPTPLRVAVDPDNLATAYLPPEDNRPVKKTPESWCEAAARTPVLPTVTNTTAQHQRKHEYQVSFPTDTLAMPPAVSTQNHPHNVKMRDHNHVNTSNNLNNNSQQHEQHHRDRMNSLRASSGGASMRGETELHHPQPTPLFERLVTEEVQELKTYAQIVERQNQELAKQKKVQEDLEARLRSETRRRKELESTLEEQERLWSEKFVALEMQRDAAEKKFQEEESKTKKLINQVQRKDRDIHDFFKKKVKKII